MVASYLMRIMPGRYLLTMIGAIELGLFIDGLIFVNAYPDLFDELRLERVVLVRDCALYLREPRNRV